MAGSGNQIRLFREQRGLTQSQLAEAIGETRQTIYKYEKGIVKSIPFPKLEKIAAALACTPAELAGWTTGSRPSIHEEISPYLTEEESRLLEAWHQASDKERSIISMILKEYGMPEPKK